MGATSYLWPASVGTTSRNVPTGVATDDGETTHSVAPARPARRTSPFGSAALVVRQTRTRCPTSATGLCTKPTRVTVARGIAPCDGSSTLALATATLTTVTLANVRQTRGPDSLFASCFSPRHYLLVTGDCIRYWILSFRNPLACLECERFKTVK